MTLALLTQTNRVKRVAKMKATNSKKYVICLNSGLAGIPVQKSVRKLWEKVYFQGLFGDLVYKRMSHILYLVYKQVSQPLKLSNGVHLGTIFFQKKKKKKTTHGPNKIAKLPYRHEKTTTFV